MINIPLRSFGRCISVLASIALFASSAILDAAEESAADAKTTNILACRLANYQKFQEAAWSHLPSIGFQYIFINVPPPDQIETLMKRLDGHGLKIAVIRGDTDLSRHTSLDELAEQLKTCKRFGVRTMFLSPKHPGVSKSIACERLRRAGDIASRYGVTIALETHPDMGANGDEHVKTMKRINHPNVRVNFDTGNITYYNHDTDAASELKKCIDYVAAVEFKDHNGQFETWNFPTIGQGAIDFRAVMKILQDHGYAGPITMEVEGVRGVEMSEEEIKEYVDRSARHIRSLGRFE